MDLDDESLLESQSLVCHKAFIEESLVQKLEREIDMEESRIKSISNVH